MFLAHEQFRTFLDGVRDKDFQTIIHAAESEHGGYSTRERRRGHDQRTAYRALMSGFLHFMRFGMKPAGVEDADFQMFRPVCESLVARGELKPEVLELFQPPPPPEALPKPRKGDKK